MDRRLPERCRARLALPLSAGALLSFAAAAWAADPESRPVLLQSEAAASTANFPWVPVLVTLAALGVAGWARWRRGPASMKTLGSGIRILSRTAMGKGRSLSLVQVGDRVVLVGESSQGFQRLAEFESEPAEAPTSLVRRVAS